MDHAWAESGKQVKVHSLLTEHIHFIFILQYFLMARGKRMGKNVTFGQSCRVIAAHTVSLHSLVIISKIFRNASYLQNDILRTVTILQCVEYSIFCQHPFSNGA